MGLQKRHQAVGSLYRDRTSPMNNAWHSDVPTKSQAGGVKDMWTGGQTDRWLMNVGEDSKGVRMGARGALGRRLGGTRPG